MRYFLIAGEPSGDLHASELMKALKLQDPEAEFYCYGGDCMKNQGGTLLMHYRSIAYMGFIPVVCHLRTIFKAMSQCKKDIFNIKPDVLILIDYPGFNLKIAKFINQNSNIPIFYYILPKVWAWKEKRVKAIGKFIDERFSILPFEVPFFEDKHSQKIHYIGNPSVDEIYAFQRAYQETKEAFCLRHNLTENPIIALLPGSRVQEIKDNFRKMVDASLPYTKKGYQILVAGAPDIKDDFYAQFLEELKAEDIRKIHIIHGETYRILTHTEAALVTSGTATLEVALMNVPQVVCYYTPLGKIVRAIKPLFLKVKYISLVNLIVDKLLVKELIGDRVNAKELNLQLAKIIKCGSERTRILIGYQEMKKLLGAEGAPQRAAQLMTQKLKQNLSTLKK